MTHQLLVPVDADSPERTRAAVAKAISLSGQTAAKVHLLSVQPLVSSHVAMFFGEGELPRLQQAAGNEELAAARGQLMAAGVPCETHVRVGRRAETIVRAARELGCTSIVMAPEAAAERSGLFGSVATQVRHLVGARADCQVIG